MEKNYDAEYKRLSQKGQEFMRTGNLHLYSATLKQMSNILLEENKRIDQIKVLMLAFYIDLSGIGTGPYIDTIFAEEMRKALVATQMDLYQFRELYLDTIRADATPRHTMKVSDTLYLLEKLLTGRGDVAVEILRKIDP